MNPIMKSSLPAEFLRIPTNLKLKIIFLISNPIQYLKQNYYMFLLINLPKIQNQNLKFPHHHNPKHLNPKPCHKIISIIPTPV